MKTRYPKEFEIWYENRRDTRPPDGESYLDLLIFILKRQHYFSGKNTGFVFSVDKSAIEIYNPVNPLQTKTMFALFARNSLIFGQG